MASLHEQTVWLSERVGVYATNDRVIHVRGDDAQSWLNGQITNDVRSPTPEAAVYALSVTVKGRIVSDLWALLEPPGMAMVMPASHTERALAGFDKHIIMEDVELALDDELRVITLQGPEAQGLAASATQAVRRYECARLGGTGVDLWVPAAALEATLSELEAKARVLGGGRVDDAGWAHAHVVLAIPRVGVDFGEDTYPQEAGLKSRAVSFNKGCYLGQEVICMLENRGQLSRRLVLLEAASDAPLAPGATAHDSEGKRVGEVTSVAVTDFGAPATFALAYLKRPVAEVGRSVQIAGSSCTVRHVVGVTEGDCPIVAR